MEKTYILRKIYKATTRNERDTVIDTTIDRDTARKMLKAVGMTLKNVKLDAKCVYHGIENGIECVAFIY